MLRIRRNGLKFNGAAGKGAICGPGSTKDCACRTFRVGKSAIISAMNLKATFFAVVCAGLLVLSAPLSGLADDSAASIAAGGLVARRETRIVMAKEVLRISETKVVVDYDFRNDTDQDVTTEVAFPIPPYKNEFPEGDAQEQSFQSFRLWVDGRRVSYAIEAKATLKGTDVTSLLVADRIDIPTFGHFDDSVNAKHEEQISVRDFSRLPKDSQSQLLKEGLFEDQGGGLVISLYTVHLQYHWTQTFPAHSTVHIRHEYTPVVGYEMMPLKTIQLVLQPPEANAFAKLDQSIRDDVSLLKSFCAEPGFLRGLENGVEAADPDGRQYAYPQWVDFILTTANTWRQPIEDFTLIVERPQSEKDRAWRRTLVSFCSPNNGSVEKIDADHFQVHLTNFVPASNLHIGFFGLPEPAHAQPAAGK